MDVSTIDNATLAGTLGRHVSAKNTETFASLLNRGGADADSETQAREAAQQLVASALVVPLLEEVRDQPLDADLFHGGLGEDSFRAELDTILADRIVTSGRFPIVDRVYEQVMRRAGKAAAPGVDMHG